MLLKDGTRRYKHLKHMANCTVEREAKEREEAEWAAIEKKYDEDYAAWVAGGKKKGLEPVKPERKVAAPES